MTVVLPCFQCHLGNKYFTAVLIHRRSGKPRGRAELETLEFLTSPARSEGLPRSESKRPAGR